MTALGYSYAYVDTTRVDSSGYPRLHHGSDMFDPAQVKQMGGLPVRGNDLDLVHHAKQFGGGSTSAFRGSTQLFCSPDGAAGAALWGEWVYEVINYRGYDLNSVLEGRVPLPMGTYGGNPWPGEQEVAIPAEVPLAHIDLVAHVHVDSRGRRRPVYLQDW